jgi:hypothetical protein
MIRDRIRLQVSYCDFNSACLDFELLALRST